MTHVSDTGVVLRPVRAVATFVAELIGPALNGRARAAAPPANMTWVALLCLNASVSLLLIALGHGAGRRGEGHAPILFWAGVILLVVPAVSRIAWPAISRAERLFLLILIGESLFLYKLLYAPTGFAHHDEFLHWVTAYDILYRHQLFLSNTLLPISPSYPGLEILTTAVANISGLDIFPASVLLMAVLRGTFVAVLFLFYEKISGSPRTAALACLVYMASPTFVVFNAMFAYESLGLVLSAMVMLAEADTANNRAYKPAQLLPLILALLASLAVTHHLSAIACALYLASLAVLDSLRRDEPARGPSRRALAAAALLAMGLPFAWVYASGNPISGYLGPVVESGMAEFMHRLEGRSDGRQLFVAADGTQQPLALRILGITATLLLAIGLATGFFRSLALAAGSTRDPGWARLLQVLRRRWCESRIVLLTLGAFGFPISVAFRLTSSGWEIGNRMSAFVFGAVGLVVAVSIVHFWQRRVTRGTLIGTSLGLSIVLLGGIITGSGTHALRGGYRVVADPESIEPMGVDAAVWARTWLGEGNRFAADRINRLLLGTYGQQNVITSISDRLEESRLFLIEGLSPGDIYPIKTGKLDYLLVDLRLSTARPTLGHYFAPDEPGHGRPPSPTTLLKFDRAERAARIFDNGWIVIFDVRAFNDRD